MDEESENKTGLHRYDTANLDFTDPAIQLMVRFLSESELNCLFSFDGIPYARFKHHGQVSITPVGTRLFKRYLTQLSLNIEGKPKGTGVVQRALELFFSMSIFESPPIQLYNRVAEYQDCLWFDLSNKKSEAVKITPDGWSIEVPEDPLFITLPHQRPAIIPQKVESSDLKTIFGKFFDLVNYDPDGRLLHLSELISSFVPNIPHPITLFYGEQGSAKTTFASILKMLVDPSRIEVVKLSRKIDQLEQSLLTHWFVPFDNVSRLTGEQSDTLCVASTGGHMNKRKLYTDGEDYIVQLDSVVSLNGINVAATRPDLLRRCVLHELPAIPEKKRLIKTDILTTFEKVAPEIMGAIFTTLSKAMSLYPKHAARTDLPSMADFQAWGCAIIEAIGHDPEMFVKQYSENREKQSEEAIAGSLIGGIILELLREKLPEETSKFETTASALLTDLEERSSQRMLQDKWYPRAPNQLSRELNRLRPNLRAMGIIFNHGKRTTHRRPLVFTRSLEDIGISMTHDDNDDKVPYSYTSDQREEKEEGYGISSSYPSHRHKKREKQDSKALQAKFPRRKPQKKPKKEKTPKTPRQWSNAILKLFNTDLATNGQLDIEEIHEQWPDHRIDVNEAVYVLLEGRSLREINPGVYERVREGGDD